MYLVTGGAGFIGGHTVSALLASGARVRVLDDLSTGDASRCGGAELVLGDIADPDAVAAAMDGVSHVIHLAAKVSVPASWDDPVGFERTNGGGFVSVLRAARAADVRRVVFASSCAVYGSLPGLPKREGDPVAPESPYAATKLANEAWASAYSRASGVSVVGLRYFNVFGPGQDPRGPYGAVIPRFVEAALTNAALSVYGDGEQGRDFVSVHDVARANIAACHAPDVGGRTFNIGSGRMMTINELIGVVGAVIGVAPRRIALPAREGDVRLSMADISAAEVALGWAPREDFGGALARTVASFRDSMSASRGA